MIKSIKATSIVEVLVIMLIIVVWTVWMYTIFGKWQQLSNTTTNRIQAIQIAREWLEAMINIRDTNYLLLSANYKECWNVLNYNSNCITENSSTTYDLNTWSYKIFKWNDNKWYMSWSITEDYSNKPYRDFFKVWVDSDWLYTQSWWIDTKPLFTRELKISYIDTNWDSLNDSNDEKMQVTSLVQWSDSSKNWVLKVELSTIITNFKNKN